MLGAGRVVAAERDPDGGKPFVAQRGEDGAGELAVRVPLPAGLPSPHLAGDDDGEVTLDVHVVRREDDHGSVAMRSMSMSRKRGASTSTPTWAFRVALEVCQRSTTVRPSQKREDVSISTLHWTVVSSVGSMTCATAIASWMGEPSKP